MSKNITAFCLVLAFMFAPVIQANSRHSQTDDIDPNSLKGGQFIWNADAAPDGAVVALVSIPKQKLYLYRNGVLIGASSVSTGKRGHETPAGIFSVLEKDRNHHSRNYDNAPMPFANRLTWDGVALHAGHVTGAPTSHGCVRLPAQFARQLYGISTRGMTVIISGYQSQIFRLAHPVAVLPADSNLINLPDLTATEAFRWQPEMAQEGSVSIVINKAEQQLLAYRNGIEIGRAKITLPPTEKNLGTRSFILQASSGTDSTSFLNHHWTAIDSNEDNTALNSDFFAQLNVPADFVTALDSILTTGSTLLIADKLKQLPQIRREAAAPNVRCINGNCIDGLGTQLYSDGSKYIGEFKNGVSDGQGELILTHGEKYVGMFKNDRYQSE
jgi:hypothetical protein